MKILITGGAGFIGCNLAAYFTRAGHIVTIFDNFSRNGSEANLAWLQQSFPGQLAVIRGDVRDFGSIAAAARGQEAIFHLAGQVAVTTSVLDPRSDFEINALGTFNTLEAARAAGTNPIFIYTSTNKVYGGMEEARVVETENRYVLADMPQGVPESWPLDFHSPYGCCYSADTDILTRRGWKRFYELLPTDEVLTYNAERHVAEYQRPTAHFAFHYKGKMYVQKGTWLRTCVTPNHKMLVAEESTPSGLINPRLLEAQAIAGRPLAYMLAADLADEAADCEAVAAMALGAEHSYMLTGKTSACGGRRLPAAGRRSSAPAHIIDRQAVAAGGSPLHAYLAALGQSRPAYIPPAIKALPPQYLEVLLQSLLVGGEPVGKATWRCVTTSRQLADDIQEVAVKCGRAARLEAGKAGSCDVYLSTERTVRCNVGGDHSGWVDYDGMVYCVEVPNSVVMVRQNGCAYFSGNSKGAGDQYVRDYCRIYNLPTVVFRQSAIYGPRQFGIEDQGWLAYFAICTALGRSVTIYGDGKQVRDLLYIDDLCRAFELAVKNIDRVAGKVFNIGGGPAYTLSVWTETRPLLEKLAGRKLEAKYGDWRPGDQRIYVSDIRRAKAEMGWEPVVGPEEGLTRLWNWICDNKSLFK